jgi:hypothetical protein
MPNEYQSSKPNFGLGILILDFIWILSFDILTCPFKLFHSESSARSSPSAQSSSEAAESSAETSKATTTESTPQSAPIPATSSPHTGKE